MCQTVSIQIKLDVSVGPDLGPKSLQKYQQTTQVVKRVKCTNICLLRDDDEIVKASIDQIL